MKKTGFSLINIFATPIGAFQDVLDVDDLNKLRALAETAEYGFLGGKKKQNNVTTDDRISKNIRVLDQLPKLKEDLENLVTDYLYGLRSIIDTKFEIGTSWFTRIVKDEGSAIHSHDNYFYSGVIYLFDSDYSKIEFHLPHKRDNYSFDEETDTPFNCDVFGLKPQNNLMILFPSNLRHSVAKNTTDGVRYSLAFNVKPVGTYGYGDSTVFPD